MKIKVTLTSGPREERTSTQANDIGTYRRFTIQPITINKIQRIGGAMAFYAHPVVDEELEITKIDSFNNGLTNYLTQVFNESIASDRPAVVSIEFPDNEWRTYDNTVDDHRGSISIRNCTNISILLNPLVRKLDDTRVHSLNREGFTPPTDVGDGLHEIALRQMDLIPAEETNLIDYWANLRNNVQALTDGTNPLNNDLDIRRYVNDIFTLLYIKKVLAQAQAIGADSSNEEINRVFVKLTEINRPNLELANYERSFIRVKAWENVPGPLIAAQVLNQLDRVTLERNERPVINPRVDFDTNWGAGALDILGGLIGRRDHWKNIWLVSQRNQGEVRQAIQDWLTFAFHEAPVELAILGDPKNINWAFASRNEINIFRNETAPTIQAIQNALGDGDDEPVADRNALFNNLRTLCRDATLLNHAKRGFRAHIQNRITADGDDQGDRNLLLVEDWGDDLNVADLYCVERFTFDLLEDGNAINGAVDANLLVGAVNNLQLVEGGGGDINSDWVNYRRKFTQAVLDNYQSVGNENTHRFANGNGENSLMKRLSFVWEELALMVDLVERREVIGNNLAYQQDFRDSVLLFPANFWNELAGQDDDVQRERIKEKKIRVADNFNKVWGWMQIGGTGAVAEGDRAVVSNNLGDDITPRNWAKDIDGTDGAVIGAFRNESFREFRRVLGNMTLAGLPQINNFLQGLHKAIAIKRIDLFLEDHDHRGVVLRGDLPVRQAADVAAAGNTLAREGDDDYQEYAAFIQNAAYGPNGERDLNGFVVEICAKITQERNMAQIEVWRAVNGCGAIPDDVAIDLAADLPADDYQPGNGGNNIGTGFRNPQAVLDDIRDNVNAGHKDAEKAAFLQRMHKEIAIAKLEEKQVSVDRTKQILKKIEEALKKEIFDEEAEELFDKLTENQKEQLALQAVTLGQKIGKAVDHLARLKSQKSQVQKPSANESWWSQQNAGVKAAIIGGALATVILVAVVATKAMKNQSSSAEEEE